jgi:hypothetical protein
MESLALLKDETNELKWMIRDVGSQGEERKGENTLKREGSWV